MLKSYVEHIDGEATNLDQDLSDASFWIGYLEQFEVKREYSTDGISAETHISRTAESEQVCLHMSLPEPYRVPQLQAELEAGYTLRRALLSAGFDGLGAVKKAETEPSDIVIDGFPIGIQHTKADSRPWRELAKGEGARTFSRSESKDSLFDALDESVRRKGAAKYSANERAQLLLLLDAGVLRIPESVLDEYKTSRRATFIESGYAQIWLVCGFTERAWCIYRC